MPGRRVSIEDLEQMEGLRARGWSYDRIAARTEFSKRTIVRHLSGHEAPAGVQRSPARHLERRFIAACRSTRRALGQVSASDLDALFRACRARIRTYHSATLEALEEDPELQLSELVEIMLESPWVKARVRADRLTGETLRRKIAGALLLQNRREREEVTES